MSKSWKWIEWDNAVRLKKVVIDIGVGYPNVASIVRIECPKCGSHIWDDFRYDFIEKKFIPDPDGYHWTVCPTCHFSDYRRVP